MDSPIWAALPATARSAVDALLEQDRRLWAVSRMREESPAGSVPGLREALEVVAERYRELGLRFERHPTPPLDPAVLADTVAVPPGRPVAFEAEWDGDTDGWFVDLLVRTEDPAAEHRLATIRHGSGLRLFNGTVPPWPEAREADSVGRALAGRLGVPFRFAHPDHPGDSTPDGPNGS
ncbi:hypothetical protein OG413_31725 [Streptomyces sp. NBC_01433]|uniref:hypothetical protein n=1 Tax=Streptomyces sp. NBC_01433 TaxID=2903864 RepID=UPI0022515CFC|nr:hypothetical protein [Streptomyces sp. NBC_01433]MCX4679801.1 hypothetical protein [Streptomyces sp. NBC_01433]